MYIRGYLLSHLRVDGGPVESIIIALPPVTPHFISFMMIVE